MEETAAMPKRVTAPTQFTCEHCGRDVPWMDAGLRHYEHRNHCPWCMHSKHIMFGTAQLPPCDGIMHPTTPPPADRTLIHGFTQQCETCGFLWATYDEDLWAELPPERQTALINRAGAETIRQNNQPLTIHATAPRHATTPPPIPPAQYATRKRTGRRP
jgi:hypothetical protein